MTFKIYRIDSDFTPWLSWHCGGSKFRTTRYTCKVEPGEVGQQRRLLLAGTSITSLSGKSSWLWLHLG